MTDFFELDINKYTLAELKNMLNLHEGFTLEDVVQKEDALRERLLADSNITHNKKNDVVNFLENVKQKLLNIAKQQFNITHNVIKRNHKSIKELNPIVRERDEADDQDRSIIKRLISVDTQFRENYFTTKSTDFQYTLPTIVKNVVSMELCGLEIPNSYYQISRDLGNDYFWLCIKRESEAQKWYFIAIPEGNYTRTNMIYVINQMMTLAVGDEQVIFDIDSKSQKSVFIEKNTHNVTNHSIKIAFNRLRDQSVSTQANSGQTTLPEIDVSAPGGIMGKVGWILGFRMAEYTTESGYVALGDENSSIKDASGNGYISEGIYNAWTNRYFYVVVDDFNKNANNFVVPTYAASLGTANILARITLNPGVAFNSGYTLTTDNAWNNTSTKKRSYFGPVDITKLKFQIIDSFGRVINLNNMDCSFALNLICLYDY
jgi:hypothetical protein